MTDDPVPHSVWQGSFHLLGVEVKCHVLSDGRRIIEKDSMYELLEAMGSDVKFNDDALKDFVRWQKGSGPN